MARSKNAASLIGNCGNDPEIRATPGGNRVATFSLATSRKWKDAAGAEQEKTEWHRCVAWGKLADIIESYVTKGAKLSVDGRIEYRQWQDKENQTRYSTEINVTELILLSPNSAQDVSRAVGKTADPKAAPGALLDDADDLPFN